jgi:NAD-dependent SIR2 family protein deacetylase
MVHKLKCSNCGEKIKGMDYAISRYNAKKKLCPACGTDEGLSDFFGQKVHVVVARDRKSATVMRA